MRKSHLILLLVVSLLLIVGYNLYALQCGSCCCNDFLATGPLLAVGSLLLLAGLGLWLALRRPTNDLCTCPKCGRGCNNTWQHCPDCGSSIGAKEMD